MHSRFFMNLVAIILILLCLLLLVVLRQPAQDEAVSFDGATVHTRSQGLPMDAPQPSELQTRSNATVSPQRQPGHAPAPLLDDLLRVDWLTAG